MLTGHQPLLISTPPHRHNLSKKRRPLSPFLATHPKNASVSPLLAAHPKTPTCKSFSCRTSEKNLGGTPPLRAVQFQIGTNPSRSPFARRRRPSRPLRSGAHPGRLGSRQSRPPITPVFSTRCCDTRGTRPTSTQHRRHAFPFRNATALCLCASGVDPSSDFSPRLQRLPHLCPDAIIPFQLRASARERPASSLATRHSSLAIPWGTYATP